MESLESGAHRPRADVSDHAAGQDLVRAGGPLREQATLRFTDRSRFVRVLGFGSWGTLITLPMCVFILSGEVPEGSLLVPAGFFALGSGLLYTALRAAVNGSLIEVHAGELVCRRAPLPPAWTRRYRLGDLASARMRVRAPSFWHPEHYRGYRVAQPYFVELDLRQGGSLRLPLTLGLSDAECVASWINARL